jgi:DNA-binding PadR family transcriptional regulator
MDHRHRKLRNIVCPGESSACSRTRSSASSAAPARAPTICVAWRSAGESQYYVEPKRLAELGYLDARREPGKTRERTVYSLTDKGLEALRQYAETPAQIVPFKSDALLRLLIADLVGEGPTRASISALRADIADLEARLDASAESADSLPHRRKYLLLAVDFLRGLLQLHLDWVERVETELDPPT